jgi:very-short-patch-repair endonuclease/predicted transcriptional regulator of viral defense system
MAKIHGMSVHAARNVGACRHSGGMHEGLVPFSSRCGGVVTTAELATAGLSPAQIRRLVRQRILLRVGFGVYATASAMGPADNPAGAEALRVSAALAVMGPGCVGSHHGAAVMHGLDLLGRYRSGPVALTRPPGGAGSKTARPGIALHTAALPAGHVTTKHGIAVTSVARTVVDLARTAPFGAGVVAADSALGGKQTSKAELHSVLTDCRRWPGIARARQVVAFSDARSESVFESISRVALRDQGLPPPDLQVWVGDDEAVIGRVDFLWQAQRTIGEADGALKYANPAQAMAQLQRDARLREAGFEVVHFTWDEITRVPAQVAASLRAAFRRQAGTS